MPQLDYNSADTLDKIAINAKSFAILSQILNENPYLAEILKAANTLEEALSSVKSWVLQYFEFNPKAYGYFKGEFKGVNALAELHWRDIAAIRLLDYIEHSGRIFIDPNIKIRKHTVNNPIKVLWLAIKKGVGGGKPDFFEDMLYLFRQFKGTYEYKVPKKEEVQKWMAKHPSGLDPEIIKIRKKNKERIINIFIKKIDQGIIKDPKYFFQKGMSYEEKVTTMNKWWDESLFHLRFAIRKPHLLNEMLDFSLSAEQIASLEKAQRKGIPLFVNPYYLSLLNTRIHGFAAESDRTIRDYILTNNDLINEFGKIKAWEKEDSIEPGKPNAAGFLLPDGNNIHRRYPEVAILIPDTVGRACGGLCVSCQRMFDFQNGHLNFNLDKLKPNKPWWERLDDLMNYFENDTQLRDILITGGDALMSSDKSLERILDSVYRMAIRKKEANKKRPDRKKYAEIQKIRLGTRLPVYIPQRITPQLVKILSDFKSKAAKIGIKHLVIQTHFVSGMEVTPESKAAIASLHKAGWIVTNQLVFTTAASRRGHAAKLRQVLNKIGILTYYTFSVKGFQENKYNFANNARSIQEQIEEKALGDVDNRQLTPLFSAMNNPEELKSKIDKIKSALNIPFLATDRNVMNIPAVGKSLSFRTIGITRYGKRILEFDFDTNRNHSPIIKKMGKVVIIESKSIREYLDQLEELGENTQDYDGIFGYSIGETKKPCTLFNYSDYDFKITSKLSNYVDQYHE